MAGFASDRGIARQRLRPDDTQTAISVTRRDRLSQPPAQWLSGFASPCQFQRAVGGFDRSDAGSVDLGVGQPGRLVGEKPHRDLTVATQRGLVPSVVRTTGGLDHAGRRNKANKRGNASWHRGICVVEVAVVDRLVGMPAQRRVVGVRATPCAVPDAGIGLTVANQRVLLPLVPGQGGVVPLQRADQRLVERKPRAAAPTTARDEL